MSNNKITGEIPDYLQNYPWGTGAGIGTSVGRDYALNIKNNCLDTTNIQDPLLSFLNQRAELDWQTTQNACAVPPPSPTPSTN
ncbi:MAG: hypothetical protein LBO09_06475 [Candidatus Peribacteria bacterium]|nr:hypothetical protein [Candidatus Peribacteria bacterium]